MALTDRGSILRSDLSCRKNEGGNKLFSIFALLGIGQKF